MTEKTLARGNDVISPPVRTSLMDFMAKSTPQEETTTEVTTDETSDDTEVTNSEEAVSDDSVESTESTEEAVDAGDGSNEQVFEVKGTKVPLKDLLNAFETREEISRRFNEVGKKEAKIKADLDKARKEREELDFINEKFEEMHELVLQGNPMAALQIALNMNPKESSQPKAMKDLIEQAITIAENFQSMSEDEQKVFLEKEELSVKERNLARKEKAQKAKEEAEQLQAYYNTILNDNGITDPEVEKAVDTINSLPQFKAELDKKTDPRERIQYCTSWVLGQRLNKTIEDGISKIDPKLAQDRDFRLALLDLVDPKSTVDDVAAIVKEFTKATSKDSANGSAASTQGVTKKVTTPNRAPTVKPKAENNKPILSWDDLVAKHSQ